MLATDLVSAHEPILTDCTGSPRQQVPRERLSDQLPAGLCRTLEGKEHIFQDGDPVTHLYRIEVGHACIYKTLSDGRRQVIDFAYPGDLIGLGAMGEHTHNAQAMTKTKVRCIPISAVRQAVSEDGRLGLGLCEAISRELLASQELLFTVGRCSASERVASFLMALSRRNTRNGQDPNEFVLPMTRWDIADFLGLTIETVSRTFTKLRKDRLIDLTQSVLVTIVNYEKLRELAEGKAN